MSARAYPIAKFQLGRVVCTPNALNNLTYDDMLSGLLRHVTGDWGDVSNDDREENEWSLQEGFRLFSVYHTGSGLKYLIISEADRSTTTVLLPEDY